MKPDVRFLHQGKDFWANVRTISQAVGYTDRATSQIQVPTIGQMKLAMTARNLDDTHLSANGTPTIMGRLLSDYFVHRAQLLNNYVEPRLMDANRAKEVYTTLANLYPTTSAPIPMNKQKGEKKAPAYLTAIVNTIIAVNAAGQPCDYDPRALTTVTRNRAPLRTLARRVDGAFPSTVNPVAIWEIKEYYYTTTFGSRVADGVYETLLDGLELEELREHEGIDVKHYLMVDSHFTWWRSGRSYLCRIFDMLHMGYVDEVLFGYEVIERLPTLVSEWVELAKNFPQAE